jgi:hypothetical protein
MAAAGGRWGQRNLRKLHLYLGVFFTPLLLFFVITGGYQTVDSDRLKSPSEAESMVQKLRVVHTDQIYPDTGALRQKASPKLFRGLVLAMSAALVLTTLLGLGLAFKFTRPGWLPWLLLGLGILAPVAVLWAARR